MKNIRTKLMVLLAVAAAGVALILVLNDEPHADGRSFSGWLRIGHLQWMSGGNLGRDGDDVAAAQAIRKIGARGVPILLAKLRATDPTWKRSFAETLHRKTSLSLPFHFAEQEHAEALYGFSVLRSQAVGAVPPLSKMLLATNNSFDSASALGYIGREAVPVLKIALTNVDSRIRFAALAGVVMSDEVTRECIAEITDRVSDSDPKVASVALVRLIRFLPPPQSLALMTNALGDSRSSIQRVALRELASAPTNGIPVGPAIVPLLQSPDQRLRNIATNVLKRIDPGLAFAHGINTNPPLPMTNFSGRGGRRGRGPLPVGNSAR